jgi:hypothetical protein
VRRCADIARLAILCSALAFLATGDGASALMAVLVLGPSVAARLVRVHPALDLVFTLALGAAAVTRPFGGGDTLPHLVLPLLAGPVLYVGLTRLGVVARPAGLVTFFGVLALGVLWELVESSADAALGTGYSQGYDDTASDLLNDTIAAAASGVLVGAWYR